MVRTTSNGDPPAEAAGAAVGLQEIVQVHSVFWGGVWSASGMCPWHRTDGLGK